MRRIVKMIIILSLIVSLGGCTSKESIKIGFIGTLTGSNSEIGIAMRDGLLLKVDEVNNSGGIDGRQVEVIIKDDTNNLDIIKQLNQEFLDQGIQVIFGHELSSKAKPMVGILVGILFRKRS